MDLNSPLLSELEAALLSGDLCRIQALVRGHGPSLLRAKLRRPAGEGYYVDQFEYEPLHAALRGGHLAVLTWLKAQGVPWDVPEVRLCDFNSRADQFLGREELPMRAFLTGLCLTPEVAVFMGAWGREQPVPPPGPNSAKGSNGGPRIIH